jgi:hypothetical protein
MYGYGQIKLIRAGFVGRPEASLQRKHQQQQHLRSINEGKHGMGMRACIAVGTCCGFVCERATAKQGEASKVESFHPWAR